MIQVTVRSREAELRLQGAARLLADRRAANRGVSIKLWQLLQRNFQAESHDGAPWAPLAPATLEARERRQGKRLTLAMILQDTGFMRQSFNFFSDNDVAGVGSERGRKVGDGVDHAELSAIHELGLGNVPARPMLPGKEVALEAAVEIYGHFVARAARG